MYKKFAPHDLNNVRLLSKKQNILRDLFINISLIEVLHGGHVACQEQ